MTIDASKVQDAYHYALAALGGSHPITGEESAFGGTGNFEMHSASTWMRKAYRAAKEAGCVSVRSPRSLSDAMNLATNIKLDARADGIDAHTGERL